MKKIQILLPIFLLLLAAIPILGNYILPNISTFLCLLLAPIALKVRYKESYSMRYFLPAMLCFLFFFLVKMKIFFLLGVGMSLFFVIESQVGKLSEIPLLLLAVFSPTLSYLANIFTFPIKLSLSKWAANSLNMIGIKVIETGNYFEMQGMSFSVDTACMGLNLLITACILTLLWIAFSEIQQQKRLPFLLTIALLLTTFLLVIFANFNRIVMLVVLHSLPNTLGHEMVGLLSLGLYVCLPIYFLIQKSYEKWGVSLKNKPILEKKEFMLKKYLFPMLLASCGILSFTFTPAKITDIALSSIEKKGFQKEIMAENIVKFSNNSTIIYLKPAAKFWGCDHSPLICWAASGYEFEKIQVKTVANVQIYVAELVSTDPKNPTLYTAWWYDNGTEKTISQTTWRWKMMRGAADFRLINVSTLSKDELEKACLSMF